jgi:hypothetical protein
MKCTPMPPWQSAQSLPIYMLPPPHNSQTPVNEHFPLGQSCSSTKCRVCLLKGQWEGLELMVTLVEESL